MRKNFAGNSRLSRVGADDIELRQTCFACPEQYDAYLRGEVVGYLRLRHGHFRVEVPDVHGELVYSADTLGDGSFEPEERDVHLTAAREAIAESLRHKECHCPRAQTASTTSTTSATRLVRLMAGCSDPK